MNTGVHAPCAPQNVRNFGPLIFISLRDASGTVQLVWDSSAPDAQGSALQDTLAGLTVESAVTAAGCVAARPGDMANAAQATGGVEVRLSALTVDGAAVAPLPLRVPPPGAAVASSTQAENTRLTQRHLDLRSGSVARNVRVRSTVTHALRCLLHGEGFTEVETPTLFRSTPEGAREFLVPSRTPGTAYALAQSPQQYKQLLMVGGLQRYFQVARCYRDEAGRSDRQPEFTQVDLELSWASAEEVMALGSRLLRGAVDAAAAASEELSHMAPPPPGLSLPDTPLRRLPYAAAMARYGSDRPDTRIPYTIHDVTDAVTGAAFPPWAAQLAVAAGQPVVPDPVMGDLASLAPHRASLRALRVPGGAAVSRSKLDTLLAAVRARSADLGSNSAALAGAVNSDVLVPAKVGAGGAWTGSGLGRALGPATSAAVAAATGAEEGDLLLFAAGQGDFPCVLLGQARLALAEALAPVPPDAPLDALWVTDFPMFELGGDADAAAVYRGRSGVTLKAAHHPFTGPHPACAAELAALLQQLQETPTGAVADELRLAALGLRSAAYDLVVNGAELGGGSIRLHEAGTQEAVLRRLLQLEDGHVGSFAHLLAALTHGAPPHGGMALGLDRTLAVLLGAPSVKDVIAFPKSTGGRELMTGAPAPPSPAQVAEYGFAWLPRA